MGTSTDALLFYGLIWDNAGPIWEREPDVDHKDWTRILDRRLGSPDDMPYPERMKSREVLRTAIVEHCYGDGVEMYGVGIIESIVIANRGEPKSIPIFDMRITPPLWSEQILHFCSVMKIDPRSAKATLDAYEFRLGWWLCSYWSP